MTDWNTGIIEEFRANEGIVSSHFAPTELLLLHTTGAKSGQERINPLVYRERGGDYVVFASKGGAPTHPDWYHNLLANPAASIEVGTNTVDVTARIAEGKEHETLWTDQTARYSSFAEYEQTTGGRQIPVVILEPTA